MPELDLPTPGVTAGPGWASQLNAAITDINDVIETGRLSESELSATIAQSTQVLVPISGESTAAATARIHSAMMSPFGSAVQTRVKLVGDWIVNTLSIPSNTLLDLYAATLKIANYGMYLIQTANLLDAVGAPDGLAVAASTASGTLPAATYSYRVTAVVDGDKTTVGTQEVAVTLASAGRATLTWYAPKMGSLARITAWKVWRGTSAGQLTTLVKTITASGVTAGTPYTFTDDGTAPEATGQMLPVINTTFGRVQNIALYGGTLDGNRTNQPSTGDGWQNRYGGHVTQFQKVDGLTIVDQTVVNGFKWAHAIADFTNLTTRNLTYNTGADGIHVVGPGRGWDGDGFYGTAGDDLVAMSLGEWQNQAVSEGDLIDINVRNIRGEDAPSAVRMLRISDHRFDNVRVAHVRGNYTRYKDAGTGAYTVPAVGVIFFNSDQNTPGRKGGTAGTVTFEDIRPDSQICPTIQVDGQVDELIVDGARSVSTTEGVFRIGYASSYGGGSDATRPTSITKLTLRDVGVGQSTASTRVGMIVHPNTVVEQATVNGITLAPFAGTANGIEILNSATVGTLRISNVRAKYATRAAGHLVYCSVGYTNAITVDGFDGNNLAALVYLDTGGSHGKVTTRNGTIKNTQAVVKTKHPVTWTYDNIDASTIDADGGALALFTAGSHGATIYGASSRIQAGKEIYRDAAQQVFSWSMGTLINLTRVTTAAIGGVSPVGQMAYNTDAAALQTGGVPLGIGPCVYTGTQWKNLMNGNTWTG